MIHIIIRKPNFLKSLFLLLKFYTIVMESEPWQLILEILVF